MAKFYLRSVHKERGLRKIAWAEIEKVRCTERKDFWVKTVNTPRFFLFPASSTTTNFNNKYKNTNKLTEVKAIPV